MQKILAAAEFQLLSAAAKTRGIGIQGHDNLPSETELPV
jgi:hypothetical protein